MVKLTIGNRPTTNPPGYGNTTGGTIRGTTFPGRPKGYWIVKLGGRVGDFVSGAPNPQIAFVAYQANVSSWVPGAKIGETAPLTVTVVGNVATGNPGGANYEAKVLAPIPVKSSQPITLAAYGEVASWWHGQDNSGATMHERNGLTDPPNPFASTDSRPEGAMSLWAVIFENSNPTIPADTLSPAAGGTTVETSPVIEFDFRDAEEVLEGFAVGVGDYLKQYQVQVWNEAGTSKLYDSGTVTASGGERTARRASWTVPGTLTHGTNYLIRAQVWDALDAPSGWREWSITVAGAGSITITSPTGRTNDTTPDFGWSYAHAEDLDMDALRIRITTPAGAIVRVEVEVDFVVDPEAPSTGTLLWTDTGWTALLPGDYRVQGQAIDSDAQPSPWSASVAFRVNSAPLAPTSLQPAAGAVGLNRPQLSALVTDNDDVSSTLEVTFYVREQGDSGDGEAIVGLWDAGTGRWYANSSAEIGSSDFDVYEWRADATDLWGLTGPASSWRAFSFVAPPTVTLDSPGDPVTSSNPPFDWTVSASQTDYRLVLRDNDSGAILPNADSGWVTSSTTGHTFTGLLLRHETRVRARLDVLTTGDIPGSLEWTFDVAYTPPDSTEDVTATPREGDFDLPGYPTQVAVDWSEVATTEPDFDGYIIRRVRLDTGAIEREVLIPNRGDTEWIDDTAASGVAYEWQVIQRVWEELDLIESLPATASASVTLRGSVLSVVIGGEGRACLRYWSGQKVTPQRDRTLRKNWSTKPRVTAGPLNAKRFTGTARIIPEHGATWSIHDLLAALDALGETWTTADGRVQPKVLCLRDDLGNVGFYTLMANPWERSNSGRMYEVDLDLQEVAFPGGEA